MRDWWLRTRLDLWRHWCNVRGHKWGPTPEQHGRMCKHCWEWEPTPKQHFGHIKISGPKPYDQTKHD